MAVEERGVSGSDLLGRVQSLVRAFGILDELAKVGASSLSDLAARVRLPRSTVHRLLTTMETLRYVAYDRDTHLWSVGIQAHVVGSSFVQTRDISQISRATMRSLASRVRHPVNLAVQEGTGMCYVGQAAAPKEVVSGVRPGSCLPMHTTASGKVMLAHWPLQRVERYLEDRLRGKAGRAVADRARLMEDLVTARRLGYAIDNEEQADGMRCVAALVSDGDGLPRATLSISDSVSRLSLVRLDRLGRTLKVAADRIGREAQRHALF